MQNTSTTLLLNNAGSTAYTVTGGTGADSVTGGTLADTISGGNGNDTITGGAGADSLTGGGNNDVFQFVSSTLSGLDVITDFVSGTDKLGFVGLRVATFAYLGSSAFTGATGGNNSEVRFSATNTLQVDTNGDGTTDFSITVTGLAAAGNIVTGDFLWT